MLRRSKQRLTVLLAVACAGLAPIEPAGAADCRAATTAGTNVLVELFTSEGCNSCPPADRWLSALSAGSVQPTGVVPIAWHVDYWDYIGWKDRFAQAAFSARQRALAELRRERVVYTPQVLLQGLDYRRWSHGDFDAAAARINARPARAQIVLSIAGRSDAEIEVQVQARLLDEASRAAPQSHALMLATTASGFSTAVRSGENSGRRLEHDHVAFGWWGPMPFGRDGELTLRRRLKLPSALPGSAGVVAFVQSMRTAEVLQALMLPVCPS